jgi:aspartokinase-like uncharacterized kinase
VEVTAGDATDRRGTAEIEVVKLGGSLLLPANPSDGTLPSLRSRLKRWTNGRRSVRVWIVGTGAWGDQLRRVQAPLGLSDQTCHWAAIDLMSVAGLVAAEILSDAVVVRSFDDLLREISGRTGPREIVCDPALFFRQVEPTLPGPALPHDWTVTSDSIAARVAVAIDAGALTLLKACPAPPHRDPQAWSEQGLVDGFFPRAAPERIELRWVDLSSDSPAERRYPTT